MNNIKRKPYFYKWTKMPHTNSSIRARLGERGFIEDKTGHMKGSDGAEISIWRRGDEAVRLHEFNDKEPELYEHRVDAPEITDPDNQLGYRNLEIQNDGSRDE